MENKRKEFKINDIISHQMFVKGTRFVVTDNNPSICGVDSSEDPIYEVSMVVKDPATGKWNLRNDVYDRQTLHYQFGHDFDDEYVEIVESAN